MRHARGRERESGDGRGAEGDAVGPAQLQLDVPAYRHLDGADVWEAQKQDESSRAHAVAEVAMEVAEGLKSDGECGAWVSPGVEVVEVAEPGSVVGREEMQGVEAGEEV